MLKLSLLFGGFQKTQGRLPFGLGVSVTRISALLAASTGTFGATVVALGLLSMPKMPDQGYCPSHATGFICASGTLGQITSASIVLAFLGDHLSGAKVQAYREFRNFAPVPVSVGYHFAGVLIPGIGLTLLYMLYRLVVGTLRPDLNPRWWRRRPNASPPRKR